MFFSYHRCRDPDALCFQKIEILVPDTHVFPGKTPKRIFDVGEINLNAEYSGETTDCIN